MEKIKITLGCSGDLVNEVRNITYALYKKDIEHNSHAASIFTRHCTISLIKNNFNGFRGLRPDISFGLSPESRLCLPIHVAVDEYNYKFTVLNFLETVEKDIPEEMLDQFEKDEIIDIARRMIQTCSSFRGVLFEQYGYTMKGVSKLALYNDEVCSITMPEHKIHLVEPIEKVTFNGSATIVFWKDEDKTVVKCAAGDKYDREKGLAMAICKKVLGDDYRNVFKEHIPEDDDDVYESPYGSLLDAFDSKGRGI